MAQNSGDTLVNPEYSRTVYNTLKDMGVEHVKYTEYKALGHNCWDKFYGEEEVWEWLFSQSL
jgi:predicted peptidase